MWGLGGALQQKGVREGEAFERQGGNSNEKVKENKKAMKQAMPNFQRGKKKHGMENPDWSKTGPLHPLGFNLLFPSPGAKRYR